MKQRTRTLCLAALAVLAWTCRPAPEVFGLTLNEPDSPSSFSVDHASEPLEIRFTGNTGLSEAALRAAAAHEISAFGRLGYLESLADDAAFQMELAYHRAGYPFAAVGYGASRDPLGLIVEFSVTEGPRVTVAAIEIDGNAAFDKEQLLGFFEGEKQGFPGLGQLLFVESEVEEAISAVRDLYYREGYLEIRVEEPRFAFAADRRQVTVHITVHEGERILIEAVRYDGDLLPEAREQLDAIAQELAEQPYFRRRRIMLKSKVQEIYANLGYPASTVEVDEERRNGGILLTCTVGSGSRVFLRDIAIHGNERTRDAFVLDRLALHPGEVYSLDKKRESFRNLYQTGLFSRIVIDLDETATEPQRDLLVNLEEAPAREVFVQGGWGSYELLRGSTGFQDRNLMGTGRTLRVEAGGSVRGLHTQAAVTDPWLLGSDITADLPVYFRRREEPSFTREEMGGSVLLSKKLRQHLEFTLGYLYKETKILEIVASPDLENPESDYTLASAKAQITWDSRNDIFFPTAGQRFHAAFELADPGIGSQLAFWRLNAGLRGFMPLAESLTLGCRYDTGLILPGRDQVTIPLGERFFNGGENTVRSFRESELGPKDLSGDPIGGNGFNALTVELRRRFNDHFAASLFVDYGNIAPNRSPEEEGKAPYPDRAAVKRETFRDFFEEFRPAVGVGFQYLLPIGPARLDFALNPDRQEERGEDRYTIHFSIGMAF